MSDTNQTLTAFTAGDLVISITGDGADDGTYSDNQASPITLEELTTTGTVVGVLVLPQITTIVNGVTEYATSGEYGSSSEGSLELSADGQSLVIAGYGVNAQTFNTGGAAVYGNAALAQSTSIPGGTFTAVPRVIADISYNGTVDTSTALYNVFNTNNPRSVATVNGTTFYISGQGVKGDTTQGVFVASDGASSATAIDTSTDTRTVEIVNGELYVSRDSTQGVGGTISEYGTTLPTGATTATVLPGIDGSITLTAAEENGINDADVGDSINLSPENYFFAGPTTLYVADGGNPKEGGLGDGGLQKWTFNGTAWILDYTLTAGLDLVPDTATSGTSGLIGLTGTVVGGTVQLYATNETIGDLDQTYLYGITDTLAATALPVGESFTVLATAAPDTNIRGISFAPSAAAATTSNTTISAGSSQSDVQVTSGSFLDILSGGTAVSATIFSGGSATVELGGNDSGSYIAQGGEETVLGSATSDTVDGPQLVSGATAVVSNESILNGGTVELFAPGAVANSATVDIGGALVISGNATAVNAVISGGLLEMESADAVLSGSLTFGGGGILEVTADPGPGFGDLAAISGFVTGDVIDLTSATSVGSAGSAATLSTTTSGGNTIATVSGGGATETFVFAGTSIGPYLTLGSDNNGGEEITALPTSTTVSSGTTSTGLVVSSGFSVQVESGGTIVSATVLSGGSATIEPGGFDSGSTIAAGGNETVLGSATLDQVFGTQLVSAATAVVSNQTVFNGGNVDLFLKGAIGNDVTVDAGGSLNISGNAVANNTVLSGGVLDLESPKATISGSLTFSGAGTLEEIATIDPISSGVSFGDQAVISGFGAGDVIDLTSATSAGAAGPGATLVITTSGGNTVATVSGGGSSEPFMFAGTTIGASLSLAPDGNGGDEIISSTASSTTISNGSTQSNVVVGNGATLNVASGGTAVSAAILNGGSATVAVGGTDTGSTIWAGGNEQVLGSATLDQIYGTQVVNSTTTIVNNETVYNGGTLAINAHGTVSNITLDGGELLLESAKATVSGTLTFTSGSKLVETATISPTSSGTSFGDLAVISGFGAGDVIDLTSATSVGSAGASATFSTTTSGGNTIATVSGGGSTQTFIFAGTTIGGDLGLATDGNGGEEIVFSDNVTSGSTQSNVVVSSGVNLNVLSGGTIVSATILSGGLVTVQTGGKDSASTIEAGGNETVLGSATLDQVFGTQLVSAATAVVTGETVFNGGAVDIFLKGGVALGLTVDAGGAININGNATTSNTVLDGGLLQLQSAKANFTGSLTFSGPGEVQETATVSAGSGDLGVISGFAAGDVIDFTSSAAVGAAGSAATLTITTSGGNTVATVSGGGSSEPFTFAGTTIAGALSLASDGSGGEEIMLKPAISAVTPGVVEKGQTTEIAVVTPGLTGDVLTLSQTAGSGTLSLQIVGGVEEVIYTAPASVPASTLDAVTYTVTDHHDNATTSATASVQLDAGPMTTAGSVTVGAGVATNLTSVIDALITPGIAGDTETITAVTGNAVLNNGTVIYDDATPGADQFTYTVADQYGGTATGTVAVTVDAGVSIALADDTGLPGSNNDTTNPALRGTAAPDAVVTLSDGLTTLGTTVATAAGTWTFTPTLSDGTYTITASESFYGGSFSAPLTFTLDTATPSAPVISGMSGDIGSINVTGSAQAGELIALYDGNTELGSAFAGSNGTWSITSESSLPTGVDSLTATAEDTAGATSTQSAPADYVSGIPAGYTAATLETPLVFGNGNNVVADVSEVDTLDFGNGNNVVSSTGDFKTLVFGSGMDQVSITSTALGGWQKNWISIDGSSGVTATGNWNEVAVGSGGSGGTTSFNGFNNFFETLGTAGYTASDSQSSADDEFHLYGGSANLILAGSNDMAFISEQATASITDNGSGLQLYVGGDAGNITVNNWSNDPTASIQLMNYAGYQSAQAAVNALVSDGHGGMRLPVLNTGASIDFANTAASSIHASQFSISASWSGGS